MTPLRTRHNSHRLLASAAVAVTAGFLTLHSLTFADELQTDEKSSRQETSPVQPAEVPSKSAFHRHPAVKPDTANSAPRRPAPREHERPSILFISANRPVPDDVGPAGNPGKSPEASSPSADVQGSQETSAPVTVDSSVLSATERFKQALLKQRRNHEPSYGPISPSAGENTDSATAPAGNTSNLQQVPTPSLTPIPSPSPVESVEIEDPLERAKATRFLMLKSQLQQLKSKLQASQKSAPPLEEIPSAVSGSDASPPAPVLHVPKAGEQPEETHAEHPARTDHALEAPHQEAEKHNVDTTHELPSALPQHAVVDGPIDRLGLANNLYAVGEYLLAMEMYEQADPGEMTAQQQIWTEYQIANCLRRTGRKAEASGRYRRLAAQPEAGWLSGQSRWWVDVLEQTRQFEKSLAEDETSTPPSAKASGSQHSGHSDANAKEAKHGQSAH